MKKKIIEQIKLIKGVKNVDLVDGRAVVTFNKKLTSVKVETIEQLDFMWLKYFGEKHGNLSNGMCIYATDDKEENGWDDERCAINTSNLIPFSQYLKDYKLTDDWEKYLIGELKKRYQGCTKYSHPTSNVTHISTGTFEKNYDTISDGNHVYCISTGEFFTIIPNEVELVDGRIYYTEDDDGSIFIFRFKSIKGKHLSLYYSCNDPFQVNECILTLAPYRKTKPATTKQSAKLVKQELKNGYFWNGTELIKFK